MRLAATVLTAATTFKRTGPAISKPRPVCAVMIRTECTGLIGQFFICCSGQVLSCVKMHLLGGGRDIQYSTRIIGGTLSVTSGKKPVELRKVMSAEAHRYLSPCGDSASESVPHASISSS